MKQVIVAGFGCAGYHAVEAMRGSGYAGAIHVFSDCEDAPANPMLTTYYIAGRIPFDALTPFGTLSEVAERFQLTLHSGLSISYIDYDKKVAHCGDGTSYPYDKLLLSTGASALVPDFPGASLTDVYTIRGVKDALRLLERLESCEVRRAVVVGTSMSGVKVAEVLVDRGIQTVLADAADRIFPLSALPETAARIEKRVRDKGVEFLFGNSISRITKEPDGLIAHFGAEEKLPCDIVILCIGTRANTSLAGSHVKVGKGIVVDAYMQTNIPDVYAAGDCCEGRNMQSGESQIIGLWANASMQGTTAGKNIAGRRVRYDGNIVHNISHFFNMDFISFGDNRKPGRTIKFESPEGVILIEAIMENDKILCLNMLDAYAVSGVMKEYFIKRLQGLDVQLGHCEQIRLRQNGVPGWFISRLGSIQP
jgi:3-phenylpropionate/trans-cinnamate dioxygenase ferredoxin reductase subunit